MTITILLLIFRFNPYEAIPISKISVFIGAIISYILNLGLKHPNREAIVIDYNICLITIPTILFGTIIGVTFINVLPSYITLLLMTFVLISLTITTFRKAFRLSQQEKEKEKKIEKILELKQSSITELNSDEFNNNSNKKL